MARKRGTARKVVALILAVEVYRVCVLVCLNVKMGMIVDFDSGYEELNKKSGGGLIYIYIQDQVLLGRAHINQTRKSNPL